MGDPHNTERYGEVWPQYRLDAYMHDLEILKPFLTLSGGWAWHFLSPVGHTEYKHAHDHKDVDTHVPGYGVGSVMGILTSIGYSKAPTIYDRFPSPQRFRRYERTVDDGQHPPFKLTIDFFVGEYPTIETPEGWKVVRPDILLGFYSNIHSSDKCWAVQSATRLLEKGEAPENLVGRRDLMLCPDLDVLLCTKCGWMGQFPGTEPDLVELHAVADLCGGCRKYIAHNLGKPEYKPRGKS